MNVDLCTRNFREIPVFPESSDVLDNIRTFLEPNILHGGYKDVDHYLRVQFSLLREDFIRPLREEISAYWYGRRKQADTRIYEDVRVVYKQGTNNGIEHGIQFQVTESLKDFEWKNSNRLSQRSLVCFFTNNFDAVAFATVVVSNPDMLKDGKLSVHFEKNLLKIDRDYLKTYVMIESGALFESYRHFASVLKEIRSDIFPLKEYIVSVSTDVKPPKYAERRNLEFFTQNCSKRRSRMPTHGVCEHSSTCMCEKIKIHVEPDWYRLNMELDQSQINAVKSALTKSICIIQGPPGTGKTHVGLCVVKLLLYNRNVWSPNEDQCPVLLVCTTNHALDQFLERILEITQRIVRIGGGSKCNALANYNLNFLKQGLASGDHGMRRRSRAIIDRIAKDIYDLESCKVENSKKLLLLDDLKSDMSQEHINSFRKDYESVSSSIVFCYWLAGEVYIDYRHVRDWQFKGGMELLKRIASESLKCEPLSQKSPSFYRNLWDLNTGERWRMYRFWLERYLERHERIMEKYEMELEKEVHIIEEINKNREYNALRGAHIVGMTTTGAAKFNYLVKKMKPKVVIVEEAAEVLEPHIVTSLCEDTQQLILIGDHQQLRPRTNSYELAMKYNMEISLFERLIKNGVPFCRLGTQHRMRPSISRLLVPHIYKDLKDHPCVSEYDDIEGMEKSMFFVTHNFLENKKEDITSHVNEHELHFLVELAHYLLLQGYQPSQIVILTTYSAQLNILKTKMEGNLNDIRATTVDNFQGEESDIVLLSFVRSNEEGKIGFLKTENRVCVALSRAKRGLYCIGNFQLFSKQSNLWQNIVQDLKIQEAIGPALSIKCQCHGNLVSVRCASDFLPISDGGCGQLCEQILPCGHVCPRKCHPDYEEQHAVYKCQEDCRRVNCKRMHKCPKRCHETCEKCIVEFKKCFPGCKHTINLLCYQDSDLLTCEVPCQKTLSCGHKCKNPCGTPCGLCNELVTKVLPKCKHLAFMQCNEDFNLYVCRLPCERNLKCGHKCSGLCGSTCKKCDMIVLKVFPKCLHQVRMRCCDNLGVCNLPCRKSLSCGHKCLKNCASRCGPCEVLVEKVIPRCRHKSFMPCSMDPSLYVCNRDSCFTCCPRCSVL